MTARSEHAARTALLASVDPATVHLAAFIDGLGFWEGRTPTGFSVSAVLAQLRPGAPELMRTAWVARAVSLVTGRCRLCDGIASATDAGIEVDHHDACPAASDLLEQWMVSEAADV